MKKITFIKVIYDKEKSGTTLVMNEISNFLENKGWKINIISFDGKKDQKIKLSENKSLYRYKKAKFYPPFTGHLSLKVFRIMKSFERKTDIFHIFNPDLMSGAGFYKVFGGKKVVIARLCSYGVLCPIYRLNKGEMVCKSCNILNRINCSFKRGENIYEKILSLPYSFLFPLDKSIFSKYLDLYIALSEDVKKNYVNFGFPQEKFVKISNFIDEKFVQIAENTIENRKHTPTLLYVGRLVENKGLELLINTFAKLQNEDCHLNIIGFGRLEKELKEKIEKLRLENKVSFIGFVPHLQLPKYYKSADIFIHPAPRPDPFPKTILEALTCNLPVLTSDVGTPPEIIENAGLTFKHNNPNDLLKKIRLLINDRNLRKSLAKNCKSVVSKYSFKSSVNKLIALYEELLESKEGYHEVR